ncbi:MAG: tetratricopeptide repeat protein, partial [Nitrospina sp.]
MNSTKNHLKYFRFRLIGMLALPGLLFMSPVAYGNPQSSDGFQEALNLIKSEQWQAAIPALQKALAENPQNSRGHANLGVALSRVNRHKEALFSYEKARSLGYDNAQFRYYQGLSLAKIDLLDDAVEEFETALKMDS